MGFAVLVVAGIAFYLGFWAWVLTEFFADKRLMNFWAYLFVALHVLIGIFALLLLLLYNLGAGLKG